MIQSTATLRATLSSALVLILGFAPVAAHAEFRGKGSMVGRILSESVAEADEPANEDEMAATDAEEKTSPRDALNALMKHPTEPVYDPLRPMSGKWVRCRAIAGNESSTVPAIKSEQDRYSSSDRTHFTRTIARASDENCKTVVSSERATYECSLPDKKTLECKVTKRESKTTGAWAPSKLTSEDEKPVTVSFVGYEMRPKKKKKAPKPRDPRKLEARIDGELIALDFEPSTPRAATPVAPTPAR